MNEAWNLDPIYTGFDAPEFAADMARLEQLQGEFAAFTQDLSNQEPVAGLRKGMTMMEQVSELIGKLAGFASLKQSVNTKDAEAGSKMGQIMAIYSRMAGPNAAFQQWTASIPNLMELVAGDEYLKDYRFAIQKTLENNKYLLDGKCEEIMARMSLSGGSAWADLHSYLTSTVPVTYRGETTTLSGIRNLAYDPDPAVRKEAYEAEIACYDRIKDSAAFAMNSLKLETINECQLRGYESPLARTLIHSDMKKETLEAMFAAIDDALPKFWEYLKVKAKALGHENGLPWYDLFAPMGRSAGKYTTEDARDYLVNLFGGFDTELRDMVAKAFDNAWIDFYPRDGKVGGAFCAGVESLGESRILTNFDGAFGDVVTLAHELGHAFHNQCIADHRPLNKDYSMPVAETASTFNECVVMNAAIKAATDPQEKLALIENQLQDATQIICDIYSRYRFETAVFANREAQFMDADALCGLMLDAQKASYGDGLDHNCLHPYMWVCKGHYYGSTFYNFPYAFGGLFARGLYAQYEKEGEAFVAKYKKLLHETPVATAEDAAAIAGIDLTDKAFWAQGLKMITDEIDEFVALVQG